MIAFVTALRARALAHDWDNHVWLLERTVASMLAQAPGPVAVVIGCHDIPDSPLSRDSRVHFLPTDIALPQRTFADMSADKVIKHSLGAAWAVAQGAEHVIFSDADDLVSDKVGAFLASRPDGPGWYAASQLIYSYGGRLVRYQQIADTTAGPFVIVRAGLLTFARPPFEGPWVRMLLDQAEQPYLDRLTRHGQQVCLLNTVGHGNYRRHMIAEGHPLQPLPFPANLVINHGDSMSTAGGMNGYPLLSALDSLRRSIRWVPTLRLATPALRREYRVPPNRDIPARYRSSGSVFWR